MPLSNTRLKKLSIGGNDYLIAASYLLDSSGNEKTYKDITDLIEKRGRIVVLDALPEASAETYELYKDAIVLVPSSKPGAGNIKDEYIIIDKGEGQSPRYAWEKIGSTDIDLTDYAKWGLYDLTIQLGGGHTHEVNSTGTIDTVQIESKKLGISRSTDVSVATQSKDAIGSNAVFTTTVVPSQTNIKATSSDISISGDATTSVITGVSASSTDTTLGEATTFTVSGGQLTGAVAAAHANDSFTANVPTTPAVIDTTKFSGGSLSSGSVTGAQYSGATQASFTQGAFTANTPTVIDTSKFSAGTAATFTQGAFTQGTLPSFTQGSKAAWGASVSDAGLLTFTWSANGNDTFTQGTLPTHAEDTFASGDLPSINPGFYTPGTAASHANDGFTPNAIGQVTAISYTAPQLTPASFEDGFYTPGVLGSAASYTQGEFTPNEVGSVSAIGVTANKNDIVTAVTGVSETGSEVVLKSVKVTAQPVISLETDATAGTGVIQVATGITSASTAVTTPDTVSALTNISSITQPVFTLDGAATSGVDYAAMTSITSTETLNISGTAVQAGAHNHAESEVEISAAKRRPLPTE